MGYFPGLSWEEGVGEIYREEAKRIACSNPQVSASSCRVVREMRILTLLPCWP